VTLTLALTLTLTCIRGHQYPASQVMCLEALVSRTALDSLIEEIVSRSKSSIGITAAVLHGEAVEVGVEGLSLQGIHQLLTKYEPSPDFNPN